MTLRIVRLGEPRKPQEGTRIGTVRRPPRGVRKERFALDDWFDVWFPDLAPSAPYAAPRLKGATGVVTKRVVGPSFAQPPYHLISDVSFPTIETLKATAASSGKEALAHAAKISSGGAPTIVVVTDDA